MLALTERVFYWPKMRTNIQEYVQTCLTCQKDKIEQQQPIILMEQLLVLEKLWESFSLDFISSLSIIEGLGLILVMAYRFSKYAIFIITPLHCSTKEAIKLIMKNMIKYLRVLHNIISDRDTWFLIRFCIELFKLLRSKLYFFISLYP